MKKIITLLAFFSLTSCMAFGQNTVLRVTLGHGKVASSFLDVSSQQSRDPFNTKIEDSTAAIYTFKLTEPEFLNMYCFSSADRTGKFFTYLFYLSPGDDIEFKADFNEPEFGIKVSGKGSNNNQPLMAMGDFSKQNFLRDSLP